MQPAKQFLFPTELKRFVECEDVPLNWRRLVGIAAYTFVRPGELKALRWDDVDLDHGTIHVHRSVERRSKREKGTKNKHARRIPIEPALIPLLTAMRREADGKGFVIKVPPDAARTFRRLLLRAGMDRAELHEPAPTRKTITFYDMRSTGITWQAVRGDDPLKIMQRAGHKDMATTMIYIRTAEQLRAGFGAVFPELPTVLHGCANVESAREKRTQAIQVPMIWRKRTGIEPARDSRTAPHRF